MISKELFEKIRGDDGEKGLLIWLASIRIGLKIKDNRLRKFSLKTKEFWIIDEIRVISIIIMTKRKIERTTER